MTAQINLWTAAAKRSATPLFHTQTGTPASRLDVRMEKRHRASLCRRNSIKKREGFHLRVSF
jgi:hypothetical protein